MAIWQRLHARRSHLGRVLFPRDAWSTCTCRYGFERRSCDENILLRQNPTLPVGRPPFARLQIIFSLAGGEAVQAWDDSQDTRLRQLHGVGKSVRQVAEDLQRTLSSVQIRSSRLGVVFKTANNIIWDLENQRLLDDLVNESKSGEEIASCFPYHRATSIEMRARQPWAHKAQMAEGTGQ